MIGGIICMKIEPQDIVIEYFYKPNCGGVRLHHTPTRITAESMKYESQLKNKRAALAKLEVILNGK